MLPSLKLRSQMLVGYAVPVALYLVVAGLVWSTANQVSETFTEVKRVQDVIVQTNNMTRGLEKMARSVRGYLVDRNEQFFKDYQAALELFKKSSSSAETFIRKPEQKERLDKMIQLTNNYTEGSSQIISLINEGKSADAIALFKNGKNTKFLEEFDKLNQEFNEAEETLLDQQTTKAKEALAFLISSLVLGSVVLISTDVVAAWLIASGVAKTIDRAVNAIATSSTEIAATIEQQERTASQQAASVNETTTTMDELGASSKATAEQAEAAVSAARQALTLAQGGAQAVEQTLEGMSNLREKVGAIAQQIVLLSEQTDQIGSISNLVSDLANQTNMLALNAAVEAVRAGDHGKGFAVVAAEIRKLAEQSKKSANKINNLVADIQNAINVTVMVTEEGTKTVETGAAISQKTVEAFAGVNDAVNDVVINNQQISLNVKQQAIAIQQVVAAMNALNQGAKETAGGIGQTKIGTQKLNEAALSLKAVV